MTLFGKRKATALIAALTASTGFASAANTTTFSISGDPLWIVQSNTELGPTMILRENAPGTLRTAANQRGVVAFDLMSPFPLKLPLKQGDYVAGKWVLPDGQGSDGTTATWCGTPINAANLWISQGDKIIDSGGRLYIRLPSVSTGMPCSLEVKPYFYAQPIVEPGMPISVVLFDPGDPLNVADRVMASPYASQSDIDTWAQPTIDSSAIQQLARVTVEESPLSAIVTGYNRALNLTCQFQPPQSMQNTERTIYVAAVLPGGSGFFFMDGDGDWHPYTGQGDWQSYVTEPMHEAPYNIKVAENLNVTGLPNETVIFVGVGKNSAEIARKHQYWQCYAIQNN